MSQITRDLLLVRPRHFGPNPETAATNAFQAASGGSHAGIAQRAAVEFEDMARCLRVAGARPLVADDTDVPAKPDAVFPNNWLSFHEDGSVVLYPMAAPNRRFERRLDIVREIGERSQFAISRIIDLAGLEERGAFLEGTGSLVLDRENGVAYAALSARTHPQALAEFTRRTGIEAVSFRTRDAHGLPVYHTNVMLSIGRRFALVCAEVIADTREKHRVVAALRSTGRCVIEIGAAQMRSFAGNVLEVEAGRERSILVMSTRAAGVYTPHQMSLLREHCDIVAVSLDTIESVGGGSARCMLAEIFLPRVADGEPPR